MKNRLKMSFAAAAVCFTAVAEGLPAHAGDAAAMTGMLVPFIFVAVIASIIALLLCVIIDKRSASSRIDVNSLPPEYRPISMWGYFGYNLLFAIPVIGQIIMLVMAFGGATNRNVRSYARSFLCVFVIGVAAAVIVASTTGFTLAMFLRGSR